MTSKDVHMGLESLPNANGGILDGIHNLLPLLVRQGPLIDGLEDAHQLNAVSRC